ncbi:MAG: hypothetical protein ACK41C_11170 [Phenylobacterium sp.]|uniref:hypothetical protein n=1 Tax=Phenylobacterium sp. TaxID=1871053 RepID=UPI00391A98EF
MILPDLPPDPIVPPPSEPVVLSRREQAEIVAGRDVALVLTKGVRREDALLRQAAFISGATLVLRPQDSPDGSDLCRWRYETFVQRQVCFVSMTGLFACTVAEVEKLADTAEGEAPLRPDGACPAAVAAEAGIAAGLRSRAPILFDADRRTHLDPLLRATGATAAGR